LKRNLAIRKALYYDKKLGIKAQDSYKPESDRSLYGDMVQYDPAFYGRLQGMIKYLRMTSDDVFVDLGCGKGRVVFFVATHKLKKVVGVELDDNLFTEAQENLRNLRVRKTPIELFHADAAFFDLSEATIIYMFHPFGRKTCEKVLGNLKGSLDKAPRKIRIVYYAPAHRDLFDRQDWLVLDGEIENGSCLVWRSK
jgi:cyclopropane fatty-acyl-phospholipid synthase-like methyltransferase